VWDMGDAEPSYSGATPNADDIPFSPPRLWIISTSTDALCMEHYQYTHHHAQALWLMTGPDWPTQLLRLQCGGVACKFTQDRMFYERALFAHQHPSLQMPPLPHEPVLASFLSMISEVVSEIQVIRLSGHPSPSRINENTRAGCYPDPTRYPHNGTARAKQHRRRRRQHIVAKARRRTGVSVQAANGESVTDLASSSHSARYLSAIHNQIGTTLHGHASWPPTHAALSLHQHPHPSCDITMCRSAGILLSSCNGRNTIQSKKNPINQLTAFAAAAYAHHTALVAASLIASGSGLQPAPLQGGD
jgi:hypothetical protein